MAKYGGYTHNYSQFLATRVAGARATDDAGLQNSRKSLAAGFTCEDLVYQAHISSWIYTTEYLLVEFAARHQAEGSHQQLRL